jgi:SlyX protein
MWGRGRTERLGAVIELLSNSGMETLQDAERRVNELEIKASFTEDLLDQLNLALYRQQQQIDSLILQVAQLRQQSPDSGAGAARNLRDELPPHY